MNLEKGWPLFFSCAFCVISLGVEYYELRTIVAFSYLKYFKMLVQF